MFFAFAGQFVGRVPTFLDEKQITLECELLRSLVGVSIGFGQVKTIVMRIREKKSKICRIDGASQPVRLFALEMPRVVLIEY